MFVQMWKKYIPNAKVSYLEYDAACATKHKTDIEAQAGGTLYIGNNIAPHEKHLPRHMIFISTDGLLILAIQSLKILVLQISLSRR